MRLFFFSWKVSFRQVLHFFLSFLSFPSLAWLLWLRENSHCKSLARNGKGQANPAIRDQKKSGSKLPLPFFLCSLSNECSANAAPLYRFSLSFHFGSRDAPAFEGGSERRSVSSSSFRGMKLSSSSFQEQG